MAIENSIGPQAGNFFKKVEKIICKIPTSFMGLEWDKLKTQLEKHTRESKARDRKFLGDLASDKFYLEDRITLFESSWINSLYKSLSLLKYD